jgi:hypothetical protein
MGDRVRRVIFTTNSLAPSEFKHLQLTYQRFGEEVYNHVGAQFKARNALIEAMGARTQISAWPSNDVIGRCLVHIKNLTSNVLVEVNLHETLFYNKVKENTSVQANVLVALAAGKMKLTVFKTSSRDILEIDAAVKTLGYDLSSRMRSIQSFSLSGSYLDWEARPLISKLLGSAIELRDSNTRLYASNHDAKMSSPAGSKLLSGSNVSHLETPTLESLTIGEADLVTVLSRCKSTLLEVKLSYVCVLGSDSVWRKVFDMLVTMPRLSRVDLMRLQQTLSKAAASQFCRDTRVFRTWTADEGRGN